ncbi:MAG: DUF1566 domain-containing protein, partial [Myxococcota bacterium]|nr:DUF1566 domain-containing protein [Myxococcota bacterium]
MNPWLSAAHPAPPDGATYIGMRGVIIAGGWDSARLLSPLAPIDLSCAPCMAECGQDTCGQPCGTCQPYEVCSDAGLCEGCELWDPEACSDEGTGAQEYRCFYLEDTGKTACALVDEDSGTSGEGCNILEGNTCGNWLQCILGQCTDVCEDDGEGGSACSVQCGGDDPVVINQDVALGVCPSPAVPGACNPLNQPDGCTSVLGEQRCSLSDTGASCQPNGTAGLGEACGSSADCQDGGWCHQGLCGLLCASGDQLCVHENLDPCIQGDELFGLSCEQRCDQGVVAVPVGVEDWGLSVCLCDCAGKACGDNGCGGSCGSCEGDTACLEGEGLCDVSPETGEWLVTLAPGSPATQSEAWVVADGSGPPDPALTTPTSIAPIAFEPVKLTLIVAGGAIQTQLLQVDGTNTSLEATIPTTGRLNASGEWVQLATSTPALTSLARTFDLSATMLSSAAFTGHLTEHIQGDSETTYLAQPWSIQGCLLGSEGCTLESVTRPVDCVEVRDADGETGWHVLDLDSPLSGDPPVLVWCDMDIDGGGWTRIYMAGEAAHNTSTLGYPDDVTLGLNDAGLRALAGEVLIGFTATDTEAISDYARFAMPTAWLDDAPMTYPSSTETITAWLNGAETAEEATLRYGSGGYSPLSCVSGWDAEAEGYGRVSVSGEGAPCWARFNVHAPDTCTTSAPESEADTGWNTHTCAERRFTILARRTACGDGARSQGEACDDGNTLNGDRCSADCSRELLVDKGDGTVVQPDAGVMWMQCHQGEDTNGFDGATCQNAGVTVQMCGSSGCVSDGQVSSGPAFDACAEATWGGYQDWRMPTQDELLGLVFCSTSEDGAASDDSPCPGGDALTVPTIDAVRFPDTAADPYWVSSPAGEADGLLGPAVDFASGLPGDEFKQATEQLRCVRPAPDRCTV